MEQILEQQHWNAINPGNGTAPAAETARFSTATYAGALTALEVRGKIICWTNPDVETAGTTMSKETAGCSTDSGAVAALGCKYPEDGTIFGGRGNKLRLWQRQ